MELGYGSASKAREIARPAAMQIFADATLLKRRSFMAVLREASEAGDAGKVQLSKPSNMEGEKG